MPGVLGFFAVSGWNRVPRALRVLLACALWWLAAQCPPASTLEQRPLAVMIVEQAPDRAPSRAEPRVRPAGVAKVLTRQRALVSTDVVLIEDRYLRFCSLLS